MNNNKQNIQAPFIGAFFLISLIYTMNIVAMNSELKQRPMTSNPKDVCIPIPTDDIRIQIEPNRIKNSKKEEINLFSYKADETCPRIYGLTIGDRVCTCYHSSIYFSLCHLITRILCCK